MMKKLPGLLILGVILLLTSCVSSGTATKEKPGKEQAPPPAAKKEPAVRQPSVMELARKGYSGTGQAQGDTFLNARNKAIMDAVRNAVIELIGSEREKASNAKLEQALYGTKNPNAFIFTDTLKSTRRDKTGENMWLYDCTVDVNLEAVRSVLKANNLMNGEKPAEAAPAVKSPAEKKDEGAKEKVAAPADTGSPDYGKVTEAEKQFIARYVDRMTYMVYFDEKAEEETVYMKSAVGKANEFLASQAFDIIDADQIEKLKEDQQTVYEEETGESISIIQWIAQKLNADIYIEIFGKTGGTTQLGGKHYGEASIELKAFEASTAVLMGSASYNTLEKAFSQTSQQSARLNAIQGAVYKTMPRLIEQVKVNMTKALTRGIRYEVIVQKPLG
ncbi:MAG TPA: hypothetical protein VMX75_08485, partial [Spirochaetia bacterium]|nr:hypothetical protein [Spirochaetia bacterium]